ncbi:MAG: GNAT family N-acetyltransferase [Gammaproteobacteria bacterium]|nr:GNAT family N-acetyltransferase [Gammaproteobacteria bacterium]
MIFSQHLETERLILRPFIEQDFEHYYKFMSDNEATRYMNYSPLETTKEGARALFDTVLNAYTEDSSDLTLVIAQKMNNQFIGFCGLKKTNTSDTQEIYFTLLPKYWGKGYATEATTELINYTFNQTSIKHIIGYASPDNPLSWGVAERVGMKYEGYANDSGSGKRRKLFSLFREGYQSKS